MKKYALDTPIGGLPLSERARKACLECGCNILFDLTKVHKTQLCKYRRYGRFTIKKIADFLLFQSLHFIESPSMRDTKKRLLRRKEIGGHRFMQMSLLNKLLGRDVYVGVEHRKRRLYNIVPLVEDGCYYLSFYKTDCTLIGHIPISDARKLLDGKTIYANGNVIELCKQTTY